MDSRAAVLNAPRDYQVTSLPVPDELPPGHSLLRIEANGLCGSDVDAYVGRLPHHGPYVPGHEAVGTLLSVDAAAARNFKVGVGDRVAISVWEQCGQCRHCRHGRGIHCEIYSPLRPHTDESAPGLELKGGLAEYMVVGPRTAMFRVPDKLSAEDASLFNAIGNSVEWTVQRGEVKLGDRVLILGAGQRGIGCAVAAHHSGAEQIMVTGLSVDGPKLELAHQYGATDTIDIQSTDLRDYVRSATDGELVDLVIDLVPGTPSTLTDAVELVRPGGRVVVAGVKGRPLDGFNMDLLWQKAITIVGAVGMTAPAIEAGLKLLASGTYDWSALHTHTFGLDDIDLALRTLAGEVPGETAVHVTIKP
jgi:threonine dehydrogenase-like Zn-dependent dehydrogenase